MKKTLTVLFLNALFLFSYCTPKQKVVHEEKTITAVDVKKEDPKPSKGKRGKNAKYKAQWQFPPKDKNMLITAKQQRELHATEEEMQWYKDAKLGIFVHWGPALFVTDALSWGRFGDRPGAGKPATKGVLPEEYDVQYKKFNPVKFDANKWMQQVKDFGASYIAFTAKHHDGFAFFDAANTDYDIMNTPFKRDICKELAEAAHRHDIKIFWYYSQPDWSHPDCLREKHYENYLPYMHEQVEQLFTNYGKIDGVFWDHLATKYWQWDSYHLYKKMKEWQPGIVSNPRCGFGWPNDSERGDFDTPEQSLGPVNHHRYWEACLTVTDKWLYHKNGPIKPAETILGMLIQVVGNGGNLLLNFGPNGEGEFVKREVAEGYKVGAFLKKYGQTIYGTRRGIYIGGDWGASTQKGNKLYLHILQKVADNAAAVFELPNLPMKIVSAKGVTEGFKEHKVKDGKLLLHFDKNAFSENLDNIVELTLSESPDGLERIETWPANSVKKTDFTASASSSFKAKNNPAIIYNQKGNVFSEGVHLKSWWQPTNDDDAPELVLELNQAKKIRTILISENMRSHSVREFEIETKNKNGEWSKVFTGDVIGEGLRIKLNGVAVYGVKLKVKESKYKTQITAFNIYE